MPAWARKSFSRLAVHVTVMLFLFLWAMPTVGLLVTSLRPYEDIVHSGWWSALFQPLEWSRFTLDHYARVLTQEGIAGAFWNSLKIALPGQMTFIPLLTLYNKLGLSGTFLGVWLAHTAYGLPLQIYLLRSFFRSLPQELFESAAIDGASHWAAFRHIALPLSVPALVSLLILQFLWVWNDLLVALIFLGTSPQVAPLSVKMAALVGAYGQDWHLLTAGAFISMLLPLLLFFSLQKYLARGILTGSLKG